MADKRDALMELRGAVDGKLAQLIDVLIIVLKKPGGMVHLCLDENRQTGDYRVGYGVAPCLLSELHGEAGYAALDATRREAIREAEAWIALKKAAGNDREAARYCKSEERKWQTRKRAACVIFGWAHLPDLGDCPWAEPYNWPSDMIDELDWAVTATLARLYAPAVDAEPAHG